MLLRDCVAARAAGWSVRVACSEGPLVAKLESLGIEQVPIPNLRLSDGNRLLAFVRSFAAAVRAGWVLRRAVTPGELVIANSINVLPATSLLTQHRVLYFGHDVLIRKDRLALLKALRSRVHLAVAVSDAVARTIRSSGIPTQVLHNGTRWPVERAAEPSSTDAPVIGIAAVLTPWKGHHVLLEAVSQLQHRETILEIMGGTPPKEAEYEASLRHRSAQPDLAGRVRFLSHVDEPLTPMRRWTIVVLPSTDPEAGPLTALEAMSVGVPVIGTDHGGMVEVIGEAGLLVPPADPIALAAAIDRLLDDPELQRRCRDAGPRQIIQHRLTLADHEQRVLELFEAQLSS